MDLDLSTLPRPQHLDRVRCINPEMKEFFAEGGVLIHAASNPHVASLVVFDKNPRAHAVLFAKDFVSEIYAKEIDFRALARDYVPPVREEAPAFEAHPAAVMAPLKRRGRPPKQSAVDAVNAPEKAPKPVREKAVKASGTGHRGRAKSTVVLTPELITEAIAAYNSGRGMVEVCKEMNIAPLEIRPAFIAAGIELRKGRRSA